MRVVFCLLLVAAFFFVPGHLLISKLCKVPAKQQVAAPVFVGGGGNLSFEKCGVYDKKVSSRAPWRVAIDGPPGTFNCKGVLVAPSAVITWGCETEVSAFFDGGAKSNLRAYVGKCCEDRTSNLGNCDAAGKGQKLEIEGVSLLEIEQRTDIHLWKVKRVNLVENHIWPICLFNKNNSQDVNLDYQGFYWDWTGNATVTMVADIKSCLKKDITSFKCNRLKNSICTSQEFSVYHQFLMTLDSDRFFLRGIFDFFGVDGHVIYTDLLPFTQKITNATSDLNLTTPTP